MLSIGGKFRLGSAVGVGLFALVAAGLVAAGAMTLLAMFVLILTVAAMAGVMVIFVSQKILTPIRAVTLQVRHVPGDLSPLAISGADEMESLANGVGALSAHWRANNEACEARLHRARQSLKLTINTLPHAIAVLSDEGQIELANETAEALLGLNTGQRVDGLRMTWLSELFSATISPQLAVTSPAPPLQVFDRGTERFFVPRAVPIKGDDGRVLGVTVILADATQSRQVDEAKGGLIASVSHELKTPLTSIKMSIGMLLEDSFGPLNPRQRELLEAAAQDAERLHRMIQELLESARGRAARQEEHAHLMADVSQERMN